MGGCSVLFEIRRIEDNAVHASLEEFVILRRSFYSVGLSVRKEGTV